MIARVRVVAETDGAGGTRLACLRSSPPVALRVTAGALYLVGTAAGPLGGDRVHLEVDVGDGCRLTVRTAAATVVLPGGERSEVELEVRVGRGASLRWLPEPTVVARGCRHRVRATVDVAAGGRLVWREEVVLGRHGEPPGSVSSRLKVDVADRPLLRQQLDVGGPPGGWDGPAVVGAARALGGVVVVDPAWARTSPPAPALLAEDAAVLPLEGPAAQVAALAAGAVAVRAQLDRGVELLQRNLLTATTL